MKKQSTSNGIGILGVLGIVFITLKLVGVITWPWWVVLLPLYGPVVLGLAIGVVIFTGIMMIKLAQTKGGQ